MSGIFFPLRYLPKSLSRKDRKRQTNMIKKSRRLYKKGQYYTRKRLSSFQNKTSSHVKDAKRIYGIDTVRPNATLAKKTGWSIGALRKIVKKGEGAFYSSGSRPNQTAQSWGIARLASSITGGKSAAVDYSIIDEGCNHSKKAFRYAAKARRKYGHGRSSTKHTKS